jgi:hypothetical protein
MKLSLRAALSITGLILGGCTSLEKAPISPDGAEITWNDGPRVPL